MSIVSLVPAGSAMSVGLSKKTSGMKAVPQGMSGKPGTLALSSSRIQQIEPTASESNRVPRRSLYACSANSMTRS